MRLTRVRVLLKKNTVFVFKMNMDFNIVSLFYEFNKRRKIMMGVKFVFEK